MDTDDPLSEVAAIAAERNATPSGQATVLSGKAGQFGMLAAVVFVLVVAAYALWQAMTVSSQLDALSARIAALESRKAEKSPVDATKLETLASKEEVAALRDEIGKLANQPMQMKQQLESGLAEQRQKAAASITQLEQRLAALEKAAKSKPSEIATSTKKQAKPVQEPGSATDKGTNGDWVVNLIALSNESLADKELQRLRKLGVRAEKQRIRQDGKVWFRLRVPGFASRDGAQAYVATLESKAGLSKAWVGKDQ